MLSHNLTPLGSFYTVELNYLSLIYWSVSLYLYTRYTNKVWHWKTNDFKQQGSIKFAPSTFP